VPGAASGELPDQEVSDFMVTETDAGKPEWTLHARSAAMFNARNVWWPAACASTSSTRKATAPPRSPRAEGEMHQVRRDMVARGNVVLQTNRGDADVHRVAALPERELRRSFPTTSCASSGKGTWLTGYGFESDPGLKHFEFKRQVQAVVRTRSGGTLEKKSSRTR